MSLSPEQEALAKVAFEAFTGDWLYTWAEVNPERRERWWRTVEALNAARAEGSSLPAGMVLVPVEPSGAMVREGSDLFANRFGLKDDILVLPMAVQGAYRAMIAAAPVSGASHG